MDGRKLVDFSNIFQTIDSAAQATNPIFSSISQGHHQLPGGNVGRKPSPGLGAKCMLQRCPAE